MTDVYISYNNLFACIETRLMPDVMQRINEELRYHPDGYAHVYSYKNKNWDGYNYLFNTKDQTFRRGLLNRVAKTLTKNGDHVVTRYIGIRAEEVSHKLNSNLIRPYEFQAAMAASVENADQGLLVSSTGTGKSCVIALTIDKLKRNTIVLVTDVVLLDQMQQVLQRLFDQPIGIIGDGEFDLQSITVSTIQSLRSIKAPKTAKGADKYKTFVEYANKVGAVISDEAHLYDSDSVGSVMEFFVNADKFIGFSATPYGWAEVVEKRENLELEQHFGTVLYDARKTDYIGLKLKVPLFVQTVNRKAIRELYNDEYKKDRRTGGQVPDFTARYKHCLNDEILNNKDYHKEVADRAISLMGSGNSVFLFASHSIEFGKSICDMIPGSMLINGKTPRLVRRDAYEAMRKKELMCIVSDVGGTGLDLPSLNSIIIASDISDARQLKGRVERACPGQKEFGLLVDFATDSSFLRKHYEIRRNQYKHDGNLILE